MGTITTTDGTEIYYKDWGIGQPIEDLQKISVPVLVIHGDDDQIVPHEDADLLAFIQS